MFSQEDSLASEAQKSSERRRIYVLDEIRGFAVVCMVFYHAMYTLGIIFGHEWAIKIFNFFRPIEPIFAALFIFISGICTRLSRSNLKRGLILFVIAIGINVFTEVFMPSSAIRFGVINLLSICMIEYGLFRKLFERLNPICGMILSIVVFVMTWGVKNGFIGIFNFAIVNIPTYFYTTDCLYPLGFKNDTFTSTDYFPIFPWFFVFSAGAYFACLMSKKTLPEALFKKHSSVLVNVGKYALFIYLLHQPLIFAAVYMVKALQ